MKKAYIVATTVALSALTAFIGLHAMEAPPKALPETAAATATQTNDDFVRTNVLALLRGNALCPFAKQINNMNSEELTNLLSDDNLLYKINGHIARAKAAEQTATKAEVAKDACGNCKKSGCTKMCACKIIFYCSKDCQLQDRACHRAECAYALAKKAAKQANEQQPQS